MSRPNEIFLEKNQTNEKRKAQGRIDSSLRRGIKQEEEEGNTNETKQQDSLSSKEALCSLSLLRPTRRAWL